MTLAVAVDATPLIGARTGVGRFCEGALGGLGELAAQEDLDVLAFAVSWRRRQLIEDAVPAGIRTGTRAMPARPLHLAWRHAGHPTAERFIGAVDVVHGTNFVVPPTARAGRVVTVHDLTCVRFPELCSPASLAYPALIRRAIDDGAIIHTPSRFVADEVVEHFAIDPTRVVAVHSGIPAVGGDGGNGASRAGPPTVLSIGTAEPRKDLPGLVKAFDIVAAATREVRLILAGPKGWGSAALEEALVGAAAHDRIEVTGWIDDEALGGLLHRASVLAYPSRYEGFGFPPLQAMALGIPVVATRAGAVPEVVGDAAELVEVGDIDGLASALLTVLTDEGRRAALVAAGTRRAAEFDWAKTAEGLIEIYRRAASR